MVDSEGETRIVSRKAGARPSEIPVTIRAQLTVVRGPNKGAVFRIKDTESIIGRGKDATVRLDDEAVSRHHAKILFADMEFRIEDLDSANGTILNGSRVSSYALRHNDKILIGESLLHFTVDRI